MSLKELLLRRAAGLSNAGNTSTSVHATPKCLVDQSGSSGNRGNANFGNGGDACADEATATAFEQADIGQLDSRDLTSMCVTNVTHVTILENKGKMGNTRQQADVTRVTHGVEPAAALERDAARPGKAPWWLPKAAATRPLVARLTAAGATVRVWDAGDQSQVELPASISAGLLREVEARGWRIIRGGRANPEAVHDSWLAGVPIADLEP